ncbi:PAS domain-containing protein [Fodinibius sp. Rm-B-1B1-1]|uniref:PAS domain-containing protein n=1 Tax=Fodinibius alkaliphilus TaxID=3140241 RepID=UPI003159B043
MATKKKIKDFTYPTPTNQKSPFRYDELFFSVTDPKSNITFANEVFVRVSKYNNDEIIGQLHKLIRHPDMPRAVFKIFWDYLKADKPVAAYVKNLAKDGSYYWVMALAFPCEGGYLSIRLKPGGPFFEKIKSYYAKTLAFEKKKESEVGKRKAMEASQEYLMDLLREEGFENYEEFMWNALQVEMHHRENTVGSSIEQINDGDADNIPPSLLKLEPILRDLVISLKKLKQIHEGLVEHSNYILKLARSILFMSLNAQVGSAKLDQDDVALSVIAESIGDQSKDGEEKLITMKGNIHNLSDLIGKLNFNIVSSKLQVEMTIEFLKEIDEGRYKDKNMEISSDEVLDILYDAFVPRLDTVAEHLGQLPEYLNNLTKDLENIDRFLVALRLIHTSGKIEVARLNDKTGSFTNTFKELIKEVETAQGHLDQLSSLVQKNRSTGAMCKRMQKKIDKLIQRVNGESA